MVSGASCRGDISRDEARGLSKGRGGFPALCVLNSWVYMVGSIQIVDICFPISRRAIKYKSHNDDHRAASRAYTVGNSEMVKG